MAFRFTSAGCAGAALALASASCLAQSNEPPRGEMPPVTISGTAPDPMTEPSGVTEFDDRPLGRVPSSVAVIGYRGLRDAGVYNLSGVSRLFPSINDSYNTTGFIETLQIRGFTLDSASPLNYRRNGLPVSNYTPFAPENKEETQILLGMNGATAGGGSPGGTVNYVTKRAPSSSLREVSADLSERGTWRLAADIGDRAGLLGYRINVATEERRPNARNAPGDRRFASGAFDVKLPAGGTIAVEGEWQRSRQISVPGFGLLARDGESSGTVLPPPIDPRINLNDQPWSLPFESHSAVGTARLEQPLGPDWTIGLRALAQRIMTNDRIAFPDGCSTQSVYVYPDLCSNYDVDIYDYRSNHELRTTRSTEVYATARLETAGVRQFVRFGARTTRYAERLPPLQAYNFVGTTNVFAQVDLPADATLSVLNVNRDLVFDELFASDVVTLSQAWSLTLGARDVRVKTSSALSDGSESVAFSKTAVTPWGALAWSPLEGSTVYVSGGSDVQSEVVPNRPSVFTNPGEVLPIGRNRQVELGYKQALSPGHWLTLALFEIRKPYGVNIDQPGGLVLRVANGVTARHRGAEFEVNEAVSPSLLLGFSATYLDARYRDSIDPQLENKRVPNVPNLRAALSADLRPVRAVNAIWSNTLSYTGTKPVLQDNSVSLPSSWQWDTSVFWTPDNATPRLQVRAGIDNVTDRRYWREAPTQSWGATYLFPAQPRTYRVGLTAQW